MNHHHAPVAGRSWRKQSSTERAATVAALEASGLSFDQVATALGLSPDSLYAQLIRAGATPSRADAPEWIKLHDHDTRLARIRELDQSGRTPRQIADELGTTSGAVVSTAFRGNYVLRSAGGFAARPPAFKVMPDLPPETWAPIHGEPVSLMENEGCKWPVDGGCCGGTIAKKSYCDAHYRVAYRSAPNLESMATMDGAPRRLKPIASQAAMRMSGQPARRMEHSE